MRIGIAQINPTLADFDFNKKKIIEAIAKLRDRKCEMVVFPECALFGYHPFDLLERAELIEKQNKALAEIVKKIPKDMAIIFGLVTKNPKKKGKPYFNSAVLLIKGQKPRFFHKCLLPSGDVFDEARFIENGDFSQRYFRWKNKNFFLTICEDIWAWPDSKGKSSYRGNPLAEVKRKPIDLVINLSASPFFLNKMKLREYCTKKTAQFFKAPLLYVNLVGAQDEVIYDGASYLMSPQGKKVFSCESFQEDFNVFDLETKESWNKAREISTVESLRRALVLGIQDFCRKTGLEKVHLGLSGGIDSALVAALAVDALGAGNVVGIGIPGPYSAAESLELAETLAKNLQIQFLNLSITKVYESILEQIETAFEHQQFDTVNENIQARLRGLMLMAYSNQHMSLLLTTGNKSEYASGYATLYGDMCGGLAPIGDLTKEQVYNLSQYYNAQHPVIPQRIIDREPTAELRPNQKDQDSLPAYKLLDDSVERIVMRAQQVKTKTDQWLLSLLMKTEFKRWQAPPILKVTEHSFGRGRRWPIAHRARQS